MYCPYIETLTTLYKVHCWKNKPAQNTIENVIIIVGISMVLIQTKMVSGFIS